MERVGGDSHPTPPSPGKIIRPARKNPRLTTLPPKPAAQLSQTDKDLNDRLSEFQEDNYVDLSE